MNRKYIDFVPTKKNVVPGGNSVPGRVARETRVVQRTRVVYREVPREPEVIAEKRPVVQAPPRVVQAARPSVSASGFSIKNEPRLGVIEDLQPKFIKTEVEKRPLSDGRLVDRPGIAEAKAKKVGLRRRMRPVEKPVENSGDNSVEKTVESLKIEQKKQVYQMPKNPFINQDKVEKRPLSKNVYYRSGTPAHNVVQAKEEPKGTVAIIEKPKKEAHTSLIVTIIITIILGAAAGTIAFLLLPK